MMVSDGPFSFYGLNNGMVEFVLMPLR